MPDDESLPVVYVRVVVNVDSLRKGFEGEVELTPRIQRLISSGYLQILGHVWEPPGPATPAPVVTLASPTRTRVHAEVVADGATGGDPA